VPSSKTSCSAFPLAGRQFVVCRAGAGLSDCLATASENPFVLGGVVALGGALLINIIVSEPLSRRE